MEEPKSICIIIINEMYDFDLNRFVVYVAICGFQIRNEDVFGFDVTMDDTDLMNMAQCFEEAEKDDLEQRIIFSELFPEWLDDQGTTVRTDGFTIIPIVSASFAFFDSLGVSYSICASETPS